MKTIEYTDETGKIKQFKLNEEIENLVKIPEGKPSKRIIKTKKGKRAIAALMDLEKNHNHSWYQELARRAKKNPNALALFYRGTKITFQEMFQKADDLAKSLAQAGIVSGDEIPVCMTNTPELVYLMLAANKLGAKINCFGAQFDPEYLDSILSGCTDKVLFVTDDNYEKIKSAVDKHNYSKKVVISLADSLPKIPELCDEYESKLKKYYYYPNLTEQLKSTDSSISNYSEFINFGEDYKENITDNGTLNTEFLVTYTSGSTKTGFPKAIIHNNRSLIVSGRFHDCELSGNPELIGLRGLAHIHPESNTDLITCISDNLMQLWSVALEPEYDKKKFLDYMILNKPNYLNATTSFYIEAAKQYLFEHKFHENGVGRKLPFLLAAFTVGEGTSPGEEKLINRFLRESRAGSGVKISGVSLPFTTVSIGGGDCEHGGIYYSLWKSLYEKLNYFRLKKRKYGLMPEPFAQVSAFKLLDDGTYDECDINEYGIIAANSATTMVGYKNKKDATRKLLMRDKYGRDWVSSNVYGYIDELGGVHVKGRVGNEIAFQDGTTLPSFMIEDTVSLDTKNILSCTVTTVEKDGVSIPIINMELQPDKQSSVPNILTSVLERCNKSFPSTVVSQLCYRVIENENSFPLSGSGKRSSHLLEEMGLKDVRVLDPSSDFYTQEIALKKDGKVYTKKELQ